MDAATQTPDKTASKLKVDKFSDGGIMCLRFSGTIDEDFDGKKLAASVKADTLVLDLADVRKISSFGIREWVDFVRTAQEAVKQMFLIECAPKVVDQMNMVANFAGNGLVVSFYAPYRCDYCDLDRLALFQLDRDQESIKSMKPQERPCETCGNSEYFDEDPTSFFSYVAGQRAFEIEPDVATFLAARLNYAVSDAAKRLRVDKFIEGRNVYLKLAGNLDASFPREKIAEGLEGTVVLDLSGIGGIDPAGAAEWRGFIAMVTPSAERLFMTGCPPAFTEKLTRPEDLGAKAQVLSFAMPYTCAQCATTASQQIDVEQHFDVLKFATPPNLACPDCKKATTCSASEALLTHVTSLPKPDVESGLRKFIKTARQRQPEKTKVATTVAEAAASGRRSSSGLLIVAFAGAAIIAVGVVMGLNYVNQQQADTRVKSRDQVGQRKATSTPERPAWIFSEVRFHAQCTELGNGLTCVGVSSYANTQEEANTEASEAALEELTNTLGLKIDDKSFDEHVRTLYGDARQLALSEFEGARKDTDGAIYDRTKRVVSRGRKDVAAALKKSGGAAIPGRPTDEYWEEYAALVGDGSKFVVYVKFDISTDAINTLLRGYSTPAEALGAQALSVFPGVAWRFPDVAEGAVLVSMGDGVLRSMGLAERYIIMSVRDRKVRNASDFATKIEEEFANLKKNGGNMKFVAKAGDGPPIEFNRPIQGEVRAAPGKPGRPGHAPTGSGTNIWDSTGGGSVRDNPNE